MTGRFQRDWGDFGGIRSRAALEYDMFEGLSNCYEVSYGDHMDPVRGINKKMYKVIGSIFKMSKDYESYTSETEFKTDIAILTHSYDELDCLRYRAASRMLLELKMPFDCVNPEMDFTKYKLIIMPDEFIVGGNLKKKLDEFVKNGGKILSSGIAGLNEDLSAFALDSYKDIEFCGLEESKRAYFQLEKDEGEYAGSIWSIYWQTKDDGKIGGTEIKIKNKKGKSLAKYYDAYFGVLEKGIHGCIYNPPKSQTEFSACVVGKNCAHICFDVFENYGVYFLNAQKELVRQAIWELLGSPLVGKNDLPSTTKVSVTGKAEYDLLHVNVTYPEHRNFRAVIEEHNVLEEGKKISVRGKYKSAKILPNGQDLAISISGDYTIITLPRIVGYAMIQLIK